MDFYDIVLDRELDRPVMILGMEGWIDAGGGSMAAVATLLTGRTTEPAVRYDSDSLLDHRARRPVMRIVDGINESVTWPEILLQAGTDDAGRDVLFLTGPEPDLHWRKFSAAMVEIAHRFAVRLVVGLGSFPAPVPHTRPVRLASTATEAELAFRVGYLPGSLDVPAGIQGAIERTVADAGIPAVGLWARVPHYVQNMPYPAASAALIDGLAAVAGLTLDSGSLREAATRTHRRIDELIANSEEHRQMVAQLEAQVDNEIGAPGGSSGMGGRPIPSGDEIAAELERYLRGESGS
jgi:hypothetical protein